MAEIGAVTGQQLDADVVVLFQKLPRESAVLHLQCQPLGWVAGGEPWSLGVVSGVEGAESGTPGGGSEGGQCLTLAE